MSEARRVVAAIDVGGTSAKTAIVSAAGRMLCSNATDLGHVRGTPFLVEEVVRICCATVEAARSRAGVQLMAVGLVIPGIVDVSRRRGVSSMLLRWRDVPFGDLVEQACGVPVGVGHDVRSAAGAEFTASDAHFEDALFVSLGTGVGGATLVGGVIRTGGHGYGGEIAHIVVDRSGPVCPCGKQGCVETVSSGAAIARSYRASTGRDRDARHIADLVRHGEPAATHVWRAATRSLGTAIATYCEILDPTVVILGGGLSAAGPLLLEPVRHHLRENLGLPVHPEILLASLGPWAGVHGAAALALAAAEPVE